MKRVLALLGACLTAYASAGCQGGGDGSVVVASVNGKDITEKQFIQKVQSVSAFNLAPALEPPPGMQIPGKAGEFALQQLIGDEIIFQTAKSKNALPSEDQVTKYVAFARKYAQNPTATMVNVDPYRNDQDWRDDVRRVMTYRALIIANTKMPEDELKKEYEKNRALLKEQNTYHIRLIDTKSASKASEALTALNKGMSFETVALKHSEDTVSAPRGGDVGTVPENYLRSMVPGILAAAQNLKPNEYHKAVIKQDLAQAGPDGQPTAQKVPHFYIVQLVERKEGKMPTFEESRFLLENERMMRREPGAANKAREDIRQATEKAEIKVNLDQYKDLPKRIKQSVQTLQAPGGPPGAPAPPGPPGSAAPTGTTPGHEGHNH